MAGYITGRYSVLSGISGGLVRPTVARSVGRAQADGAASCDEVSNSNCGGEGDARQPPVMAQPILQKETEVGLKPSRTTKPLSFDP